MVRETTFVRLFFVILGALTLYFFSISSLPAQLGVNVDTQPQVEQPLNNIPEEPQVPPIPPEIREPIPPEIPVEVSPDEGLPPDPPADLPPVDPPPADPPPADLPPDEVPNLSSVSCSLSQFFPSDGDFLVYSIGGEVNLTVTMNQLRQRLPELNVTQNILGIDVWFVVEPNGRTIIESPQDMQAVGTTPFFFLPRHAEEGLSVSFGEFQLSIVSEGRGFDFSGEERELWIVEGEIDLSELVPEEGTSIIRLVYERNSGILLRLEEIGGAEGQTEVLLELTDSNIDFNLAASPITESRQVIFPTSFVAIYSHSTYDFKVELQSVVSEATVNITESRRFPGGDWQLVGWRIVDMGCDIVKDAWSSSLTGGFMRYEEAKGTSYRFWALVDLELGSFIRASPTDTDPGLILEVGLLRVVGEQELNIAGEIREVWIAESVEDLGGTILRFFYDKSSGLLVRQESEVDGEIIIILELLEISN